MSGAEAEAAPAGRGAQRREGRFVWRGRAGAGGPGGQSRDALKNNRTAENQLGNKTSG